jgi:transcriptional regulator with XRE-family HTH domain
MGKRNPHPKPRTLAKTYIRAWREFRGKTQDQCGQAVGISESQFNRIENGKSPYNQVFLELAAEYLETDVASLLMRDPTQPAALWSLWDHASVGERKDIERLVRVIVQEKKTG